MDKEKTFSDKEYFVYVLECFDKTFYTGVCVDLKKRLRQHNGEIVGGAKYTEFRGPVKVVYFEKKKGRSEAQKKESLIKKLTKKQKQVLIDGLNN
jgi:putative endonuclease